MDAGVEFGGVSVVVAGRMGGGGGGGGGGSIVIFKPNLGCPPPLVFPFPSPTTRFVLLLLLLLLGICSCTDMDKISSWRLAGIIVVSVLSSPYPGNSAPASQPEVVITSVCYVATLAVFDCLGFCWNALAAVQPREAQEGPVISCSPVVELGNCCYRAVFLVVGLSFLGPLHNPWKSWVALVSYLGIWAKLVGDVDTLRASELAQGPLGAEFLFMLAVVKDVAHMCCFIAVCAWVFSGLLIQM